MLGELDGVKCSVHPEVVTEIRYLVERGYDVQIVELPDELAPSPRRQSLVDWEIDKLENDPLGSIKFRAYPGIGAWAPLTKRAIALQTLYNPDGATLGDGISPAVYKQGIFDERSAYEVLISQIGREKAHRWLDAYVHFVGTTIDDGDEDAIGSRDLLKGVADSRAVRSRAAAAIEMAASHFDGRASGIRSNHLVSASLACGAATPVYSLCRRLETEGHQISSILLVDRDPMALATAFALAEQAGLVDKIGLELRDLLTDEFTDYIAPLSVDIVDVLGLFEYLPREASMGNPAATLLKRVTGLVRPGGIILLGNMLQYRPQQRFFSGVVEWPRLYQRRIGEVLNVVHEAGFEREMIRIRVPTEGVYAILSLEIA